MQNIKLYNAHCCGEIGDVVVGLENFNFESPKEASTELFKNKCHSRITAGKWCWRCNCFWRKGLFYENLAKPTKTCRL